MTEDEVKSGLVYLHKMMRTNIEIMIDMAGADVKNIDFKRKVMDEIQALAEVHILDLADIITDKSALIEVYMTMLAYGLYCSDKSIELYETSKSEEVKA